MVFLSGSSPTKKYTIYLSGREKKIVKKRERLVMDHCLSDNISSHLVLLRFSSAVDDAKVHRSRSHMLTQMVTSLPHISQKVMQQEKFLTKTVILNYIFFWDLSRPQSF